MTNLRYTARSDLRTFGVPRGSVLVLQPWYSQENPGLGAFGKDQVKPSGWTELTHKVLKLLDHPYEPLCSHANIILVESRPLVNNLRLAISYLDDVDVRKTSSLCSDVNRDLSGG